MLAELEAVLAIRIELLGEQSEGVARTLANLGSVNASVGNAAAAAAYYQRALAICEQTAPADYPTTGFLLEIMGRRAAERGDHAFAVERLRRARDILAKSIGEGAWQTAVVEHALAISLVETGDAAAAQALLERAHAALTRELGTEDARTRART